MFSEEMFGLLVFKRRFTSNLLESYAWFLLNEIDESFYSKTNNRVYKNMHLYQIFE